MKFIHSVPIARPGVCLFTLAFSPVLALGQTGLTAQTRALLRERVSLKLGSTTASRVATHLSQRTGLHIGIADYLRAHKVSLYVEDMSVISILNSLTEMNGWEWGERERGVISITRKRVAAHTGIEAIPTALHSALPQNLREYVGLSPELGAGYAARILDSQPEAPSYTAFLRSVVLRVGEPGGPGGATGLEAKIWMELPNLPAERKTLPYNKWSSQDRDAVLRTLFNATIRGMLSDGDTVTVLNGALRSFQKNPRLAQMKVDGGEKGMLLIGTERFNGGAPVFSGFGWSMNFILNGPQRVPSRDDTPPLKP